MIFLNQIKLLDQEKKIGKTGFYKVKIYITYFGTKKVRNHLPVCCTYITLIDTKLLLPNTFTSLPFLKPKTVIICFILWVGI